jgi:hypothetical protein
MSLFIYQDLYQTYNHAFKIISTLVDVATSAYLVSCRIKLIGTPRTLRFRTCNGAKKISQAGVLLVRNHHRVDFFGNTNWHAWWDILN